MLQTSFVTSQQFKAHKAYNQFVCGWVKYVTGWKINNKSVVTGRVSCFSYIFVEFLFYQSVGSQRYKDPIVICEHSGEVICAHCNCIAGLSEVCTPMWLLCYFFEASNRLQGRLTCTKKMSVDNVPVKDLDFISAKGRNKKWMVL